MKHLLIDKKLKDCSECVYLWYSPQFLFVQCDHPERNGKLKSLPDNFSFPSWCPLPEVKK